MVSEGDRLEPIEEAKLAFVAAIMRNAKDDGLLRAFAGAAASACKRHTSQETACDFAKLHVWALLFTRQALYSIPFVLSLC